MDQLEKLNIYLKANIDVGYYKQVRNLIKLRVSEIDQSIPKLLNKAFNHRYTISRIEKAKADGRKGLSGTVPDYNAQIDDQYRQIKQIQDKIQQMKSEYEQFKKAMITFRLLNDYHLEINGLSNAANNNDLEEDLQDLLMLYLFNTDYEQKLIDGYKAGLNKEGLGFWNIKSVDDIKLRE